MIHVTLIAETAAQRELALQLANQFEQEKAAASTGETVTVEVRKEAKPAAQAETTITLVEVRGRLAELSKAGKAQDVKKILNGYGVTKLTDLPAERYAELMKNVEQL
jgi:pantothenate synthetase